MVCPMCATVGPSRRFVIDTSGITRVVPTLLEVMESVPITVRKVADATLVTTVCALTLAGTRNAPARTNPAKSLGATRVTAASRRERGSAFNPHLERNDSGISTLDGSDPEYDLRTPRLEGANIVARCVRDRLTVQV